MIRSRKKFVCQECGYGSLKWMGRCPGCGKWNTMVEEIEDRIQIHKVSHPVTLDRILAEEETRYSTGLKELDRVLGGGIVQGSLVLIGGDPGIGKSTLLLQVCNYLGNNEGTVLYVSGEESVRQVKIRASRLCISAPGLYVVSETDLDVIFTHVEAVNPRFLVIDSIQTIFKPQLSSAPGSVSQVREATATLMQLAKGKNIAVFIVGHVTKEGAIAGPRVLEHMVDTVLYFEGDAHHYYRILRAVKNRFGSTNEIGIFEMREKGLVEVYNPSELLLSGRMRGVSGSVVLCSMEGTRPVLVEIQALVSTTAFGMARRMATGIDCNRVIMLMAVLEKKIGMQLYNQDTYVNVVGGLKIDEPAADLAVIAAIASSFRNLPISHEMVVMGEVGLTGEVRGIDQIEKRIAECIKLGFKTCVIPQDNLKALKNNNPGKKINIVGVKNVSEALGEILG